MYRLADAGGGIPLYLLKITLRRSKPPIWRRVVVRDDGGAALPASSLVVKATLAQEAGADFLLMPSRFEPCGLNQMYGLRYSTIPIVHTTGGLDDTVIDVREDPVKADGIKFMEYSTSALAKGITKALVLFEDTALLKHFQQNAMAADFSWDRTVAEYLKAYQRAVAV